MQMQEKEKKVALKKKKKGGKGDIGRKLNKRLTL